MTEKPLPIVALLGTGGTIASTSGDATRLTDYTVTEGADALVAGVPGLEQIARIRCRQLFNVESHAITNTMLLQLAREVNDAARDPEVDGIVITHGTDTMEESAYFLNLTVKSDKPVVLVGAMRPGSAVSADGPLNLYNAVLLAGTRRARNCGVMVVLNDSIHAARFVTKTHATAVDTFGSRDQGCLGWIFNGEAHIVQTPALTHTVHTEFEASGLTSLPPVDILYDHQNAGLHLYRASIDAGVAGIVVAGCGNGNLSPQAIEGVALARSHGIVCVRGTRTGAGAVSPSVRDAAQGLIASNSLNPQKARLLLMLALTKTKEPDEIQRFFDRY